MQSYQRFQCIGHTDFNTSGTNGPRGETGAFPPPVTAGLCVASEIALNAAFATLDSATLLYTYISRFSVTPHYRQQLYLRPSFIPIFNFSHKRPTFAFTGKSGYTLGFRRKIAHSGSHAETGAFSLRSQRCLVLPAKSSPKEPAGESGCTPMACVRFLRHRDPAGLRKPILLLQRGYFCTATSLANSWNFQSRLLDIPTSIAKPSVFCYNILKSR